MAWFSDNYKNLKKEDFFWTYGIASGALLRRTTKSTGATMTLLSLLALPLHPLQPPPRRDSWTLSGDSSRNKQPQYPRPRQQGPPQPLPPPPLIREVSLISLMDYSIGGPPPQRWPPLLRREPFRISLLHCLVILPPPLLPIH